jgi:hypothetical protein
MSHTLASLVNTSRKATTNSIPATKLKSGMKVKVLVDKQSGDDEDRVYRTTATIANLRATKSGKYIHFDLEEFNTDEPVEVDSTEFVVTE